MFCGEILVAGAARADDRGNGDNAEDQCRRQLEDAKGVNAELVEIRRTEIDGDNATVRE